MELKKIEIRSDIRKYQSRIQQATSKLQELPDTVYGWKSHKELDRKRRRLLEDIKHNQRLIEIAELGQD